MDPTSANVLEGSRWPVHRPATVTRSATAHAGERVARRSCAASLASGMPEPDFSPLSLHFRLSSGSGELKVPFTHPVVAAFRRGIEEGQLTGTWRFLLTTDTASTTPTMVGAFVETPKGRFLYFPGAEIEVSTGTRDTRFEDYALDHLTLDPPKNRHYYRSHIAVRGLPERDSRGLDYRASASPGFLFPWFSLLLPGLHGFATLPAHLYVEFPSPRSDLETYGQQLMANGGMIHLPLPAPPPSIHYIQFDIWVGHGQNWRDRQSRPIAWAYKPEIVADAPPGRQDIQVRTVDTDFRPGFGIRIMVYRPRGRLLGARILRPRFNPVAAA